MFKRTDKQWNEIGMKIAVALVTACVAVGTAGIMHACTADERAAAAFEAAGTDIANGTVRMQPDAGGAEPARDALIASDKPSPGAAGGLAGPDGAAGGSGTQGETEQRTAPGAQGNSETEEWPDARETEESRNAPGTPGTTEAAGTPGEPAGAGANGQAPPEMSDPAGEPAADGGTGGAKRVLIYHSHNRESWLPELKGKGKTKPNEAFDEEINVTLLGARLAQKLEEAGVGALHSEKDYPTAVKNFNYNYSYSYSKTTVKEALAVHRELAILLDIHRDSSRGGNTTLEADGKSYAKVYFIVGKGHPHWEENEAFAERIHDELEKKMPGLSRGILTKGAKHGHGEYNQSLSPGSVLIEVGGVDNTLEESYRTIDLLASVIAALAKESE